MASAFDNPVAPSTCDQCGNPAEDTVRCSVRDSKNLCRPCFRDLPSREDIGEPEWVCDIHASRKVEFFCERCKVGCCKECAIDVHSDHKVVDVVKLAVEIRQKLQAQLEEVNASAEVLSELRNKVNDTMNKIKETPMVVEKVVREIKEEVQRNLDEEIHRIKVESQLSIMEKEKQRDRRLKLAKEKADRDIQRILAIQHDINTDPNMLGIVAEWSNKMEKTKATLLDREQACESANLEIKSMLDAVSPEKIIRRGRQLNSLVKTSSALRIDQMDINASCKKVEADIPECEVNIEDFFKGLRPFPVYKRFVSFTAIILYFAWIARENYRNEYNKTMLSSESLYSLTWSCLLFPEYNILKFVMLFVVFAPYNSDYPIKIRSRKLKVYGVILCMGLQFWLLTSFLLFIVSSPFYLSQVKNVNKDVVSVISFLQSCLCIFIIHYLRSFKTFFSYMKVTKFEDYKNFMLIICVILVIACEYVRFDRPEHDRVFCIYGRVSGNQMAMGGNPEGHGWKSVPKGRRTRGLKL